MARWIFLDPSNENIGQYFTSVDCSMPSANANSSLTVLPIYFQVKDKPWYVWFQNQLFVNNLFRFFCLQWSESKCWRFCRSNTFEIKLKPLSHENILAIVQAKFSVLQFTPAVSRRITTLAKGNAMYAISLVSALIEAEHISIENGKCIEKHDLSKVPIPGNLRIPLSSMHK